MKSVLNLTLFAEGTAGMSNAYTISSLYRTPPQLESRNIAVERDAAGAGVWGIGGKLGYRGLVGVSGLVEVSGVS